MTDQSVVVVGGQVIDQSMVVVFVGGGGPVTDQSMVGTGTSDRPECGEVENWYILSVGGVQKSDRSESSGE